MVLETALESNPEHPRQQRSSTSADAGAVSLPEAESTLETGDTSGNALFDNVHQTMERFAATSIGQFMIERGDRLLRIIEETAKWSLSGAEKEETTLRRPLPWLPFLVLIITLRQLRFWLSLAMLVIGNGPVTAYDLVYFIQTRRRKLRSIRIHGLKAIRRDQERHAQRSSRGGCEAGFMVKLGKLFTIAICRPGHHSESVRSIPLSHGDNIRAQRHLPARCSQKRQREDDTPEADLTCHEMLAKYANENSEEDSDYMPNCDEETNDETTSTGDSFNESQSEEKSQAKDEQPTEKENVDKELSAKEVENSHKNGTAEQSTAEPDIISTPTSNMNAERTPKAAESETAMSSSESPLAPTPLETPQENGPSNGGENREADVVKTRIFKTFSNSARNHVRPMQNGHSTLGKRVMPSEVGSTAAVAAVRTRSPPLLGSNNILNANAGNVAAPLDYADHDVKDVKGVANDDDDDNDDETYKYISLKTLSNRTNSKTNGNTESVSDTLSTSPSQPCSTASSSTSSLASFVTSDEFVVGGDRYPDAPTPTPSLDSSHLDSPSALYAASSTEDVFYSPIGSPPDFNAFNKSTSFTFKQPTGAARFNPAEGHSTPKTLQHSEDELPTTSHKSKQIKTQQTTNTKPFSSSHRNRKHRR